MNKMFIIWGYWEKNFGDDLFLISLKRNLGSQKCLICSKKKYKDYYKEMGYYVVCNDSLLYRIINKISKIFKMPDPYFWMVTKSKVFVMLGGSLFAENKNEQVELQQIRNLKYAVNKSNESFVIGSNFGPYKNNWFFEEYYQIFKNVKDICFRDYYSYKLFSDKLDNIRFSNDIALEGEWNEYCIPGDLRYDIVISAIDLTNRIDLCHYRNEYENFLLEICRRYVKENKRIALIEFCEKEGDCEVYNRIKSQCDSIYLDIINYKSIEEIITIVRNCDKIYATRFHAIMMGMYFGKKIVPIVYNEKTVNALKSYSSKFDCYCITEINKWDINRIMSNNQIILIDTYTNDQFKAICSI